MRPYAEEMPDEPKTPATPAAPAAVPPAPGPTTAPPFAVPVVPLPIPGAADLPAIPAIPAIPAVAVPMKMTVALLPAPAKVGDINIPPTTTAAEDLSKSGQRRINLIWESMQAAIAASVVATTLFVSARLALLIASREATEKQEAISITAFMLIGQLVSLVIGFYFGRTNHQRTGGVRGSDGGR